MPDHDDIRVLLVDDQQLMLEGLRTLLDRQPNINVVGEVENGAAAIEAYAELQPQVVLMDIRMPVMDGVAATRQICLKWPSAKIIILTTFDDDEYVFEGIRAGAVGYMLKAISGDDLANSIRVVAQGGSLLEPSVARKVLNEFARQTSPTATEADHLIDPLTEREIDILGLLGNGFTNREIADKLYLAEGTVKNYVTSILQKLDVRDRTQAALRARDLNLLD